MKMSKRDSMLVIALMGVLLFLLVFFYLYKPLKAKTEVLQSECVGLQETVTLYEQYDANKEVYLQETEKYLAETKEIQEHFLADISREDQIMVVTNLERQISDKMRVDYMNMSDASEVIYQTQETDLANPAETTTNDTVPQIEENNSVSTGIRMFMQPIEFGCNITYEGFKLLIANIFATPERKSIQSVNLSFDSETGNIRATMQMNQYFMTGTENVYQQITIPNSRIGTNNIFHSIDVVN